ncbi:radical SAM protein [Porcipelethomonas sp.]|uniref:radical SAM protein n=1 Tax=Porcipelethomonas sp. TaxID=2981675 RepID=UPI003EF5CD88
MNSNYSNCKLCPRQCGTNRSITAGVCGSGDKVKAAKACLHYWEEPPISGKNGSGAVFFSGCSLKCCFCQNYQLSHDGFGREITTERLGNIFLELQEQGAENINLVNPTHYVYSIIKALDMVKHKLNIPVVYNSGGYDRVETLRLLKGYIDIYLPDLKYFSSDLSKKYSQTPDYFEYASKAILEMHNQQPELMWNGNLLQKGLIIRHLILPGCRHDSIKIIKWLSENLPVDSFLLSLMSQYTPTYNSSKFPEINRKVTTFEYNSVLDQVIKLNINGYTQDKKSASLKYTPDFNLNGI